MQIKRVHKEDRCPDYDTRYCLLPLIKALGVKDPVEFYLSTSMYPCLAPFLSEADKANLIGKVLSNYNNFPLLFPPIKQGIKNLKICPKCADEEIKGTDICQPLVFRPTFNIIHQEVHHFKDF